MSKQNIIRPSFNLLDSLLKEMWSYIWLGNYSFEIHHKQKLVLFLHMLIAWKETYKWFLRLWLKSWGLDGSFDTCFGISIIGHMTSTTILILLHYICHKTATTDDIRQWNLWYYRCDYTSKTCTSPHHIYVAFLNWELSSWFGFHCLWFH